jgi:hypothetical protein
MAAIFGGSNRLGPPAASSKDRALARSGQSRRCRGPRSFGWGPANVRTGLIRGQCWPASCSCSLVSNAWRREWSLGDRGLYGQDHPAPEGRGGTCGSASRSAGEGRRVSDTPNTLPRRLLLPEPPGRFSTVQHNDIRLSANPNDRALHLVDAERPQGLYHVGGDWAPLYGS